MTARSARTVAWSVGISSIALMVAGLVFRFLDRSATLPLVSDAWSAGGVFDVVANLTLPFFGIVIVSRRRENPIGWLFLVAGSVLAFSSFGRSYALHALVTDPGALPAGRLVAWLSTWIEAFAIALLPWLFLLFPTGNLPSRRWRPLGWLSAALLVLLPASFLVFATEIWNRPFVDLDSASGGTLLTVAKVAILGSVLALVLAILASNALGSIYVDFGRLRGRSDHVRELQLSTALGTVTVLVPFDAHVRVDAFTGLGTLGFGTRHVQGLEASDSATLEPRRGDGATFIVHAEVGLGDVYVLRYGATKQDRRELRREERRAERDEKTA